MHKVILMLVMVLTVGTLAATALAAPPADGQDYTVQTDDWLSRLAEKFYGDPAASTVILEATNARAVTDDRYRPVAADAVAVGQKLFIPTLDAAELAARLEPAGPTPEQQKLLASLPNQGTPPELFNEVWLNSEPLKLANLHGKVVIIEFWTFG